MRSCSCRKRLQFIQYNVSVMIDRTANCAVEMGMEIAIGTVLKLN